MSNAHLFELINAPPGLDAWRLGFALFLARWMIVAVAAGLAWLWVRTDRAGRVELLQACVAMLAALLLAEVVGWLWPQPRPFVLHLGTQYLGHTIDAGLPSDHVTVLWALAFAALGTRRFGLLAFPLLTIGLLVGWSRVYLGVHFPYDVAAALPVAAAGALAARAMAAALAAAEQRLVMLYERLERRILASVLGKRRPGKQR